MDLGQLLEQGFGNLACLGLHKALHQRGLQPVERFLRLVFLSQLAGWIFWRKGWVISVHSFLDFGTGLVLFRQMSIIPLSRLVLKIAIKQEYAVKPCCRKILLKQKALLRWRDGVCHASAGAGNQ
jgi:hypothetical protein